MLHPRLTNRRRRARLSGFALVEVLVALFISAIMVTAMMGVALTAKQGGAKAGHRMMFDQGIAQLSSQVKQYVTACGCLKSSGNCTPGAAPTSCRTILGPNTNNSLEATWYLNGSSGGLVDATTAGGGATNLWALSCGNPHYVTGVVPSLEVAPYSGYIMYTVTWPNGCTAASPGVTEAPQIAFTASWTEP